ncbi:hypothetical protein RIF25_09645 [Thermosynechococcaceae cyanobacterium BACA0444]|uniref:Restriction endonuclease domain-containing protein n=1 Tax=Pseudocalidococcus azoricus BACA0444 TaxID=2918990 RepID=A0AAE4FT45_9CYAN|nr:hypothetical protein [Pseudocalidococcus azoricus]MDS3861067.1 hypothetical protein [Pseudocalidococcus azoricus BACA0444]
MIATTQQVWTDEAFMAFSQDGHRYELVNGELVDMGSTGMEHGYVACILVAELTAFVRQRTLFCVCACGGWQRDSQTQY